MEESETGNIGMMMDSYVITIGNTEFAVRIDDDGVMTVEEDHAIDIRKLGARTFSVIIDGMSHKIVAEKVDERYHVLVGGSYLEAQVESERARLLRQYDQQLGSTHKRLEIHAPMPALVVRVNVAVGQEVPAGQGLIILEAMKMENEIKAHTPGKVKQIFAEPGKPVEKGELLMLLE